MTDTTKRSAASADALRAELAILPTDWRLVRVGPDKAPIAGKGWFDVDDYSPDDAALLNGSMPPAWGLKSGPASGVVILDLDSPGWRESFQEVTGHPITDLPRTIAWSSGKPERSAHAFAVNPDWWPYLRNRINITRPWREGDPLGRDGKQTAVTIWELRWDRHQSVLIGAHPQTGRYQWLEGQSPADIPDPAPAPDWLLEVLVVQEVEDAEPIELTAEDADRAVAMLNKLPPEDFSAYDDWLRVGMALHHTDPGLLTVWVDWSRKMSNFDEAECLRKWASFGKGHRGRPATIRTLHHLAKDHGYREPKRSRNDSPAVLRSQLEGQQDRESQAGQQQDAEAPSGRFTPQPGSTARWGHKRLNHSRAMACFDRCVWVQSARERNALRRRARLLKAATDLGILKYINRQEIAQRILEAKDRQAGRAFQLLSADDRGRMERPRVEWLIRGLIPANDMSIIGGRPKVGKTRAAMALIAAVLKGESFLDAPAAEPRDVILVSDDQADGDTADMLDALQLWEHPRLDWSRHFRLTEHDLESLLEGIRQRPGALVVIDSLRSISRSLSCKENDPELGALVYDLKEEVIGAGGTLLLIHHCNKADGLIGVEALSGHSSIAGAVNGVLTLHYVEDDKGKPIKDAPQRRLVNEGRSTSGFDVVISPIAGTARFYRVSTWQDWRRAQKEEGEEEKKIGRMPERQKQVLAAVERSGEWMTRRQVCEALGVDWGDRGRSTDARGVGDALARLAQLRFLDSQSVGREATYRSLSHEAQLGRTTRTTRTSSDTNGSGEPDKNRTTRTTRTSADEREQPPADSPPLSGLSGFGPDKETRCSDSLSGLSGLSGAEQPTPSPGTACRVDGQTGWRLPGALPRSGGKNTRVLVISPSGTSQMVELGRITLAIGRKQPHAPQPEPSPVESSQAEDTDEWVDEFADDEEAAA